MKNKKELIYEVVLISLGVLLIITTLYVPLVHIVAHNNVPEVVYDKVVNLMTYTKDAVFVNTDASDVYFSANGPMWLPVAGILFNYLFVAILFVMIGICAFDIFSSKKDMIIKQNNTARKLSRFVGIFGVSISIFQFVSFIKCICVKK